MEKRNLFSLLTLLVAVFLTIPLTASITKKLVSKIGSKVSKDFSVNLPNLITQSHKKLPIVYHDNYDISFWKLEKLHPFDTQKYSKVYHYLQFNMELAADCFYKPEPVSENDLLLAHSPEYLDSLNQSINVARIAEVFPLKFVPNFLLQRNLLTPMKYATGGTILGAQLALEYGWAINLSGGYHHAKRNSGEGFCFFADIPIAIQKLWKKKPNLKVMIIDLDAHQGNGVESILKNDKRIHIVDLFNADIYPQDIQAAQYIKTKLPVHCGITNEPYLSTLKSGLSNALNKFTPDLIIYNAGTDIFKEDPLGRMSITQEGIIERDQFVFNTAQKQNIPILMVLSGGYAPESAHIISKSVEKIIASRI
ncbi:MAG: histone deacetylase [bacterium]|nr:histone deacetylase [bacterium]